MDILEQLPDVYICWKDKDSVFLGCNQKFADLIGKSKEEIIGTRDSEEKHVKDDKRVLETKKPLLRKYEKITDANGKRISIITNKSYLSDENGEPIGIIVIFVKLFS